jgi:MFS family permease
LSDRSFRRLYTAQVTSLFGTGLTTVALALLAHDLAGNDAGAVLGSALALKMVAYLGVAPVVGGIAHRLPRRALLVGLDLVRAGLVLLLPFVTETWQLYVLIFLLNACSAGFTPVFQAMIPDLLPDEARYTRALSLSRLAYDLENLLSPTLAAILLGFWRFDLLFQINAIGFVLSALLVASATLPRAAISDRDGDLKRSIGFGIRAYLATPRLRGLLALYTAVAAAGSMVIVNTVVYVRSLLGLDSQDTAIVFMAAGAGSMLVALAVPRLLNHLHDRPAMLAAGFALASLLALGTLEPGFTGLLSLWFLLGAASSMIQTPAGRLVRLSSGSGDRSAYFSANFALSHGAWLLGYLLAGWLGSTLGMGAAFGGLSLLAGIATLSAMLLWPADDPVERLHHHPAQDHEHPHVHDEHHRHEHEGWEGPEPHRHPHHHAAVTHRHPFTIDRHHPHWPG